MREKRNQLKSFHQLVFINDIKASEARTAGSENEKYIQREISENNKLNISIGQIANSCIYHAM